MKPFIISHIGDCDGASPVILGQLVFGTVDYHLVEVSGADTYLLDFLNNPESSLYDMIYVTDLGLLEGTIKTIDEHVEWKKKVRIIDHHHTNLFANDYSIGTCIVEEDGVKQCATTLFYRYLKTKYGQQMRFSNAVEQYVELVRLIDTWDWVKENKIEARQLGQLFDIYGPEYYIEHYLKQLKELHNFHFSDSEEFLLEIEEKKYKRYLERKKEETIFAKLKGHDVAIVFAEQYRSALGNDIAITFEDKIDFVVIVTMNGISFRGNKDIDLGVIAETYGGGGHARSAGCAVTFDTKKGVLEQIFPSIASIVEARLSNGD